MKINGNTKVSKVIKENKEAIEVIASLNPHFSKLRNPILRRLLAPRVTLAEAARIGNCDVQKMLAALVSIGFELDNNDVSVEVTNTHTDGIAKKEFLEGKETITLDVRPFLAKGEDPFNILQKTLKKLKNDEVLEVLIDFVPIPLIRIQEKKGFSSMRVVENGVYHTYFKAGGKVQKDSNSSNEALKTVSEIEFNEMTNTYPGELIILDVRNLEMPEPLMRILEAINNINEKTGLKIFHKRIPIHLLPELENKNLKTFICPISEGNVMMFIIQKNV